MGNWNVSISGVGIHHNYRPDDIEQLVKKFLEDLAKTGMHTVTGFEIHIGSLINNVSSILPVKEQ